MAASATMYPDWPESLDDLVPLPQCEGPKLKPFDFQGPQKIKFLEYIDNGLHAHVFKVEILGSIYALKLFRFCTDVHWGYIDMETDREDAKVMSAFANYSEPFNNECRAFGRLHETNNSDLAMQCFGYVLLDEDHEKTMLDQFMDKGFDYDNGETGDLRISYYHDENNPFYMAQSLRPDFPGKNGKLPPIRGIVKEFVQVGDDAPPKTSTLLKAKRDVIALHQLGIIGIDITVRNLMDGKFGDFSTAVTTPHYITNPELNPHLTPEWISAIEYETFQFAITDYKALEHVLEEWHYDHEPPYDEWILQNKNYEPYETTFFIFPRTRRYKLRKQPDERLYSLVHPRLYDWRSFSTGSKQHRPKKGNGRRAPRQADESGSKVLGAISRPYRQLLTRPPRWYLDQYGIDIAARRRDFTHFDFEQWCTSLEWEFKGGFLFPHKKGKRELGNCNI